MKRIEKSEFSIMTDMLIILIVISVLAVFYYGLRAFLILLISSAVCFAVDRLCLKLCGKKNIRNDISAVLTGLVIALMLPASVPYYIIVIADIFAIVIGKHAFGGLGHAVFNNSAVGFLFVALCFPEYVLSYPKPFTYISVGETLNPVELYPSMTKSILSTDTSIVSVMDMLIGKFNGPMGTSCMIVLLISAFILIFRRSISAISFFTQICAVFGFTFFYADFDIIYTLHILSSGMFVFGILFLACDYSTIPKTKSSRFIYGIIVALLTIVFHFYAKNENAIVYAVIIAAPIGIELDKRAISFADMVENNRGIMFKINQKFNKNLSNVNETLNLVNDGSDSNETTDRITIHSRDERIFTEKTDI